MRSITIREEDGKWYMNYMKLNSEDDIEISKEIAEEIMKFQQIENLCSICKKHPAECDSVTEEQKWIDDTVIQCSKLEILNDEELWLLKRCKNLIGRIREDLVRFDNF